MKNVKSLFISITLAAAFGCFMVSCSDDAPTTGPGTGPESTGTGYFSFFMSTPETDPGTRAEEEGSAREQWVYNAVVLLYDAEGEDALLRYKFELNASNVEGLGTKVFDGTDVVKEPGTIPRTKEQFVSTGREVRYQDYQMVVLVNYLLLGTPPQARSEGPASPDHLSSYLVIDQSTLSQVHNLVYEGDEELYRYATRGFFMSNANGVVKVSRAQLQVTPEAAEANPVKVKVDRILAKVRLFTKFPDTYTKNGSNYVTADGVTIGPLTWGVSSTNTVTYLIRHLANLSNGSPEANVPNPDRAMIYAIDPNFREEDDYYDKFRTIDSSSELIDIQEHEDPIDPDYGWYVLENTLQKEQQSKANFLDYTTHIYLKAIIAPQGMSLGNSYYSYVTTGGDARTFTHQAAKDWVQTGIFPANMPGLKEKIEGQQGPDAFDFTENSAAPNKFMTNNGITYHHQGVNVYRIPIRHFTSLDPNPVLNTYGFYGVVRNNVYNVRVTSIGGPGAGGTGWISADISVNKWFVRDQDEDL